MRASSITDWWRPRCYPRISGSSVLQSCLTLVIALSLFAGATAWALQFDRTAVIRHAQQKYPASTAARLDQWFGLLDRSAALEEHPAKLAAVNTFWNSTIRESSDNAIWKQDDYWATPLETLSRGLGDCEDFVIGKYFSLVHLGVPADRLRLIYVRAKQNAQSIAHMVLGYYERPDADPLILDNLRDSIQPASQRPDLTPVFSFDADGIYVAGTTARSPVDRISRWQGLLLRMRAEGFQP